MRLPHLALAAIIAVAATSPYVYAQISPGTPNGILSDQFQLNPHPQMQFAASAPSGKYQEKKSAARKRGDIGDPMGCNLQCPDDR